MDFPLTAQKRDVNTKLSSIRNRTSDSPAQIPAVIYGHKIQSAPLTLDYSEFLKLFRKAGTSHVITLHIGSEKHDVLVQDLQRDPVTGDFTHVDFQAIVAGEKIHTKVPIVLVGESPVTRQGMMIEQNLHEVEISCLPKDLLGEIEINIEAIQKEGDVLHLSDVKVNREKIHFSIPEETAIASAHTPRAHKVEDDSAEEEAIEGASEAEEEATQEATEE